MRVAIIVTLFIYKILIKEIDIMVLIDVLKALANNDKLFVTLTDIEGTEKITFNVVGYEAIESDLGAYFVKDITITAPTKASISISETEITETNDDTTDPSGSDPSGSDPTNP